MTLNGHTVSYYFITVVIRMKHDMYLLLSSPIVCSIIVQYRTLSLSAYRKQFELMVQWRHTTSSLEVQVHFPGEMEDMHH